ncbi:MAG: chorismate synthase [Candidatus Marinamargulisbacteria bacterium]|jgi:chorismate synthase
MAVFVCEIKKNWTRRLSRIIRLSILKNMGNTFGKLFCITTWGESHGAGVGVVIDGCPPQIDVSEAMVQKELDRRRPGQSKITTPRKESDEIEILSGVFEGKTLGTPISMMIRNKDANPKAYNHLKDVYRPSHADYTFEKKYGIRDFRGGGRSSARETIGRVAAGAIARRYLAEKTGIEIVSYVTQIHCLTSTVDRESVKVSDVDANIVRCPDQAASEKMVSAIEKARKDGDSLGGIIECVVRGVPAGLGDPVFDKLKADLAKAMMSIPATMGFQIGSGFSSVEMLGSEHNDPFFVEAGRVRTRTNRSGGIQGGISNGEDIVFQVAFKPTGTISKEQETVNTDKEAVKLEAKGRHDPCVLPRAVPIVDAMTGLVLMDHFLRQRAIS